MQRRLEGNSIDIVAIPNRFSMKHCIQFFCMESKTIKIFFKIFSIYLSRVNVNKSKCRNLKNLFDKF